MNAVTVAPGEALLTWRGHRIFVQASGQGEALLLIHGFPTSSHDWHRVLPGLEAHYRVLRFDLLGFGQSDKPRPHRYRIAEQADLAEAVLAHFGVERCRILAHDYGDTVAQELLARQNAGACTWRLQQLVLLNGGLFPEAHRALPIQRLLASRAGPLLARLVTYRSFASGMRRICSPGLADADIEAMWMTLRRADGHRVLPALLGYLEERRAQRARWVGALCTTRIPLRLIDGIDDPISGGHMVQRYRELVPQPDAIELPGVGHYPQLEAPDLVLAATLAFFQETARDPG